MFVDRIEKIKNNYNGREYKSINRSLITPYELDDIIDLNKQQLIVCSSVDNVIEAFLINIFKNIVIDQKRAALYIDNCLVKDDCSDIIKKEREMLFENKK